MKKPIGSSHELDDAVRAYVHWRNECHAVQDAYVRWETAEGDEAELAYAGYLAALELEERAADVYRAHLVDTLRNAVAGEPPLAGSSTERHLD